MRAIGIRAALLAVTALAAGCSLPNPTAMEHLDDIPPAEFPAIDAIPDLAADSLRTVPHTSLAEISGVSCRRTYGGASPSWEDAVRRTKYRAMQNGANAITNLTCGFPEGKSLTTLCLESIRCTASGIRIEK